MANTLIHVDIVVDSTEEYVVFLRKLFDFSIHDEVILTGDVPKYLSGNHTERMKITFLRFSAVGAMLELMEFENFRELPQPHSGQSISFFVGKLGAVVERAKENGLSPESEIMHVTLPRTGTSSIVFFRDPQGRLLELVGS